MKRIVCAIAVLSMALNLHSQGMSNMLEPAEDLFSHKTPSDRYYFALRDKLIDERVRSKCQMLVMPSNSEEWVVYLLRDKNENIVVAKHLNKSLWYEIESKLQSGIKQSFYTDNDYKSVLEKVDIGVIITTASINNKTADILEDLWFKMLFRVQNRKLDYIVTGGEHYNFSHWAQGYGFMTGTARLPLLGRVSSLVQIGSLMNDLTRTKIQDRIKKEEKLAEKANTILMQLNRK